MTNPDRSELVKLADTVTGHVAALANEPLRMPLTTWNVVSNDILAAAESLRRLASSDGGVKVKPLVWRDHRPDSFPEPAWSAQTSFGFYNIEEVSASDSPAYVVRLHAHHFVADKDSLDEAKAAAQADYEARIRSALVEVPAVKGEPEPVAWPANLNPRTLDLVQRFALALAKKLRLAEEKYGHTDGWLRDDWEAECRDHLYQHLEKGDPRDVAAYCAFMWHHGWITYRPEPVASKRPVAFRVRQHRLSNYYELYTDEKDAQFWADDRGVDYEGLYLVADRYLAPPADAGMREALDIAFCAMKDLRDALHREPSVQGRKWVHLGSSLNDAIRKAELALTAPGATTKSDGGVEGHAGVQPAYPADIGGSNPSESSTVGAGIKPGPSDTTPSSRPEVSVEDLRSFIYVRQPCTSEELARALKAKYHMEGRG